MNRERNGRQAFREIEIQGRKEPKNAGKKGKNFKYERRVSVVYKQPNRISYLEGTLQIIISSLLTREMRKFSPGRVKTRCKDLEAKI